MEPWINKNVLFMGDISFQNPTKPKDSFELFRGLSHGPTARGLIQITLDPAKILWVFTLSAAK